MSAFFEHFRFAQPGWLLLLIPALLLLALRRGRGSEAALGETTPPDEVKPDVGWDRMSSVDDEEGESGDGAPTA